MTGKKARVTWLVSLLVVALFFLIIKAFSLNPYVGDEYIYLYQAKLVSEGVAPYSGFSMAHPPFQMIVTGLMFKIFGFGFLFARLLPVMWCLLGGLVLAWMVWRELGGVASVAAALLFLGGPASARPPSSLRESTQDSTPCITTWWNFTLRRPP